MASRTEPGTLYGLAQSAAQDAFDTDDSGRNADKVCAVALHIAQDTTVALFSGKPGYDTLVERFVQKQGGTAAAARTSITSTLTAFLGSDAGGGFSQAQIRKHGFADHDRGAMNCAEPKVYFHIKHLLNGDPGNWVMIPFNKGPNGLIYNPPCGNCREWVYGQFHALSRQIASSRGGPGATDSKRP